MKTKPVLAGERAVPLVPFDVRAALGRLGHARFWAPVAFGAILVATWEVFAQGTNPLLFAPPSRILRAFPGLLTSTEFHVALGVTIGTMLLGFVAACVLGIALGVLWGLSSRAAPILQLMVNLLYPLPRIALIPLTVVWFGIDLAGRLFIIVFGTVFDVMVNTHQGIRYTDRTLLEVGRSFGASRTEMLRHIILPDALPHIMAGIELAIGRSLVGVIVAELFLAATGMGGMILTYGTTFRIPEMLGLVFTLSLLGLLATKIVRWAEVRLAPWKFGQRHEE